MSKPDKKPWRKRVDINLSFSYVQCELIYEALDLLNDDYEGNHPESEAMQAVKDKMLLAQARRIQKRKADSEKV